MNSLPIYGPRVLGVCISVCLHVYNTQCMLIMPLCIVVGHTHLPSHISILSCCCSVRSAVQSVNSAIQSGNRTSLLRSLQSEDAHFTDILPQNLQWYLDILSKAARDKAETEVSPPPRPAPPNHSFWCCVSVPFLVVELFCCCLGL